MTERKLPHVVVLMSTYNGEKYLEEQLISIVNQKGVDVRILVRDDGSTDATHKILNDWQNKSVLRWYSGENLRPARSFMQLLSDSDNSEYYAFSDQDDYWYADKLYSAIEQLSCYNDIPALYFCQTQLADNNLNPIDSVIIRPFVTFGEALVYQFVGGCTMVLNKRLRDIVVRYRPDFLSMHDVWIYNVALAIGAKVLFDPTPHMLYRQHGNNVVGQGYGWMKSWKHRFSRLINNGQGRYCIAREIEKGYMSEITATNAIILNKFINGKKHLRNRIRLLTDKDYRCSNKRTYRNFQIALILNTY